MYCFVMGVDKGLEELLTGTFEVDSKRAEKVAANLTLDQFYLNFARLESIVGFEGGVGVVKDGDFLDYRNHQLEIYFQLAMEARSRMDSALPIPIKPFYSIESLKRYLGIKKEERTTLDHSKLNIASYKILHKDNPQSRDYLNSLIEMGEVIVEGHEHWNKGIKDKGPRGLNILKRIGYELKLIFRDLELGEPDYKINFGQMKLGINDSTRSALRQVRESAYSLQK